MSVRLTFSLAALWALFLVSCDKDDTAVPEEKKVVNTELASGICPQPDKVNGFLFLSMNNTGSAGYPSFNMTACAAFRDPAKNAMQGFNHRTGSSGFVSSATGVVQVGQVRVGAMALFQSSFFYNGQSTEQSPTSPHWRSDGNKTFVPLNVEVARGYPLITYTNSTSVTLSRSQGWALDLSNFGSNYDSVAVSFSAGGMLPSLSKCVGRGAGEIRFSAEEIADLDSYYYTLIIHACNYSHITLNNKVYLFELGRNINTTATIIY
jgi:hypothetical protein